MSDQRTHKVGRIDWVNGASTHVATLRRKQRSKNVHEIVANRKNS